jgi:hypothetical protein
LTLAIEFLSFLGMFKLVAIHQLRAVTQTQKTIRLFVTHSIGGDFSFIDECSDLSIRGDARVVARTANPATG